MNDGSHKVPRVFHAVRNPATMGHGNGFRVLHIRVERPTMGCLAWMGLTSQMSTHDDFVADDPNAHTSHGELSILETAKVGFPLVCFLKKLYFTTFGEKKDFSKAPLYLSHA